MISTLRKYRVVLNALVGQAMWFVCVVAGARGVDAVAVAAVAVSVMAQTWLAGGNRGRLLAHMIVVAACGVLTDSALTAWGVIAPVRVGVPHPWTPWWLAALWLNFASLTAICLRRLGERPLLAVVAGAVGGPLAYAGGIRFGAVAFPMGWASVIVLAAVWAVAAWGALVALPRMLRGVGAVARPILLLCTVALPVSAWGAEATFPVSCTVDGQELTLHGLGRLSRWMITGCDVALYLPRGLPGGKALDDVPKRLHLHYYRTIRAEQFSNGAGHTLERAFGAERLAPVRERVEQLHAAYRDVARGDEYTLSYAPGAGTTLALNGAGLVTIPGADFAAVYFAVWLGEPPIDAKLKSGLMRRREVSGRPLNGRMGVSE